MQTPLDYVLDRLALRVSSPDPKRQVGAIPYVVRDGRVVLLLVTSRRTGRWIFPKGSRIDGLTPWQAAAQEALEEAGVEGDIESTPIGAYRTIKKTSIRRSVIEIDLYPLRVTTQHQTWQDIGTRHRHWVLLPEAKRLLSDPALAALSVALCRRVLAADQEAIERMRA
jgi:8-oxo-dGTP pyrophosphatase MutT (NUDIX family)